AQTGVYRESLFETFRPVANKKQIRAAIALAKQFGLRSDPALRDAELGTYYQVDVARVESFEAAIQNSAKSSIVLNAGDDIAKRLQLAVQTVRLMLVAAQIGMITLILIGSGYLITGQSELAAIWWTSALCVGGLWLWQKTVAKPLL
ncbi:hypothetical protein, partial [Synechococcus sp. PCC 7335]|uniref:hypothetical protein n=1 Tax=Synechococcus sp. (strain ATCC 29403 / PCC 7335) TaxID=91464 RepID=UPI0005707B91